MILIAHRGNVSGKKPELENHPDYIKKALEEDYQVEIDVWYEDKKWLLGHDKPTYEIEEEFLLREGLWCHAKNIQALRELILLDVHCFWHQEDDVVLTTRNYMWTFPGKKLTSQSVAVHPERSHYSKKELKKCSAICSDNIKKYKKILGE
tara:strand:- start:15 stop:464 length:450 start_codon:yes stop_codon:yes gene_type:complete